MFRCGFSAGLAPARDGVFANPASPAALHTLSSEKMGDSPLHPVRSTAKKLNPATALREHEKATPHRAGIATLHGPDRRRNRDRKARLIGPGSRRGSAGQNTGQWRSLTLRFQGQHTHLIQPPGISSSSGPSQSQPRGPLSRVFCEEAGPGPRLRSLAQHRFRREGIRGFGPGPTFANPQTWGTLRLKMSSRLEAILQTRKM